MKRKVINIAHRGYTRRFPDNTLEAFRAAIELGVDGVEFDVQETADREFFIFHDDDIEGKPIASMFAHEMEGKRVQDKYRIPSLEETLKLLGTGMILLIELKQVKSLNRVIDMVRSHTDISRVVISSFRRDLVAESARLAPDIMSAVIADYATERDTMKSASSHPAAIGMRCDNLDKETVEKLHSNNTMVFVWDCADAESVKTALKFDIDGIISDVPDIVKSATGNSIA